ncbi:hypothetical protein NUW58_g3021 [Xylaria curta]|uniref:Uncharacterized protein n=1 Tax=Xylaria curta TaxID=42375 RepID=A0ACC1PEL2_9PEZI|nr:hypothetical protein NUW58_g3021 [Xylaria curta]
MPRTGGETPEQRWKKMTSEGHRNAHLSELMEMSGLQDTKWKFLDIQDEIEFNRKFLPPVNRKIFGPDHGLQNAVFLGNSGTGKTTIARLYSRFIAPITADYTKKYTRKESSGSLLASKGISGITEIIDEIKSVGCGALFIDDAYRLVTGGGASILDYLVSFMGSDLSKRIVFVFAGHQSDMEKFFEHNRGISHRIRHTFKLQDYDESQIQQMLQSQAKKQIGQSVQLATCQLQTQDPLFLLKVIARRIIRSGGVVGSGNGWAIEKTIAGIKSRHSIRVGKSSGPNISDRNLLTVEDLLGPGHGVDFKSEALDTLNRMIGLEEVKKSVQGVVIEVCVNRARELADNSPLQSSLNKVFLGNPGTGKTTVAKLYGQILVDLGMLSNSEVVTKTPADFISGYAGGSEGKTKAVLESTKGKVLIIDEAYGFGNKDGAKGTHGHTDSQKSAVIDTLVANIDSRPGEDRCVLLLGYKDKMEEMYQDANPGLKRRFPLDTAFVFDDFAPDQLRQIWKQKLKTSDLDATEEAEKMAMEILERQRHKLHFGNAGEVDIIVGAAMRRYVARIADDPSKFGQPICLEAADVDPDYQRLAEAANDVEQLFKGIVGCDEVKETIRKWPKLVTNAKKKGLNICDILPMNFAFTGPPGTGKTTTAKNIGTILYSLGLLASNEVKAISATELIGEYVGQTGPKVRRQFEASLGKVLFIDEAYRLSNSYSFGQDATDEIVTCLTEDKFKNHLVVIFAGYENHIKSLLNQNPGLASRVPGKLHFPPLTSEAAIELLSLQLNKDGFRASFLKPGGSPTVARAMQSLVTLDNWANGRSIENPSKDIKQAVLAEDQTGPPCYINEDIVLGRMEVMRKMLIQQLPEPNDAANNGNGLDATAKQGSKRKLAETSMDRSSAETNKKKKDLGASNPFFNFAGTLANAIASNAQPMLAPTHLIASYRSPDAGGDRALENFDPPLRPISEVLRPTTSLEAAKQKEQEQQKSIEEASKRKAEADEDAKRKEAEAEAEKRVQLALASKCCMGYGWKHVGGGKYVCAGGSHEISFPNHK